MADPEPTRRIASNLELISATLQTGTMQQARRMLNALHPAEIAHLLESMPPAQRELVWELVDPEYDGEVLLHLGDEVRQSLIQGMDAEELIQAAHSLDVDDLADLIQDLPHAVLQETLEGMDKQRRQRLEAILSYPEDSAGGLMDTDTVTVRADVTLDVVLRYLLLARRATGPDRQADRGQSL